MKKIVLDSEWKLLSMFFMLMVLFSLLSSLFAAFFACFGEPETGDSVYYFDMIMEICFILDIFRNFFTQYIDPERPEKPVTDLFSIWIRYVKGPLIFDLLAISAWPLRVVVRDSWKADNVGLIYLLRLFRIPKILILMNLQGFTRIIRKRYRNNLMKVMNKP